MSRLKEKLARLHRKSDTTNVEILNDSDAGHEVQSPIHEAQAEAGTHSEGLDFSFDDPYAEKFVDQGIGLMSNEFGSFLIKRINFPATYEHGMYTLKQLQEVSSYLQHFFPDSDVKKVSIDQLLFFDLETTGLGTGTGNIPFMVGLGYFSGENYIVEQAVIRHVAEERALLAYLHRLTASYEYLVTYNGKTFDWPLMVNRYVLNGMREEIWQPKHIDLLHPSRSIWRNTLDSCRLSYIEEARLGITRIDDLPGSEAPERYFKYLAEQNPEHLFPVYRHNELDMLTLVSLLIRFGYLLSDHNVRDIIQLPNEPEEMIRTGLWLEKMGLTTHCESLFEIATLLPVSYAPTLYKLSLRDKQVGNIERAILIWNKIIDSETLNIQSKIDCCVQLAIYYEHKCKWYEEAIKYTELAINLATILLNQFPQNNKRDFSKMNLMGELDKRLLRLTRKLGV